MIDDVENVKMPLLVYVSREKMASHPHHFKAGALNVLVYDYTFFLCICQTVKKTCFTDTTNIMFCSFVSLG